MGMTKYFLMGWLPSKGLWVYETLECATMEAARKRFLTLHPTLKTVKVYPMRQPSEMFE